MEQKCKRGVPAVVQLLKDPALLQLWCRLKKKKKKKNIKETKHYVYLEHSPEFLYEAVLYIFMIIMSKNF